MIKIEAKNVQIGHWIDSTHMVREISSNSLGNIIFRCAYDWDGYPGLSIIIPPDEIVEIDVD